MQRGSAGGAGGGGASDGAADGAAHAAGGGTPGQLRAEALTRAHALRTLADAVAATQRDLSSCRDDPSWSGRAHDAFLRALDDLAGRVALAATLLHDATAAAGAASARPGAGS
ncbi:hypothetical protein [Clavibacter zhangzhiyongii]|uniref:hypothetical protein n=1 Tax=Clavibacter zhangzhiyongii TaxID=2768071 RepID=UPI0039E1E934